MKKSIRIISFVLTLLILAGCGTFYSFADDVTVTLDDIGEVNIHTEKQQAYIDGDPREVGKYASGTAEKSYPEPVILNYSADDDVELYRITVSTDPELKDAIVYETEEEEFELFNLLLGKTYFVKVTAVCDGEEYDSEIKTISVNDGVIRNIYVDGITNVRDLGNWKTSDGGKVRQGMIYRTGKLNADRSLRNLITDEGIFTMRNVLGIKSEIDLRQCGPLGFESSGEITEDDGKLYYSENGERIAKGIVYLDGKVYLALDGGEIFRSGEKEITAEMSNGIIVPGKYSFHDDGTADRPSVITYENGCISHSPIGRSDQNGIVKENGEYYYYENGIASEKGLILLGGNYFYVSDGGRLYTDTTSYVYNSNGLLPVGSYIFDELGRIVSNSSGRTFDIYPVVMGDKGSGIYDVNYYRCTMNYTDDIFSVNSSAIKDVFAVLSKRENYPIIFHCSIGTDRTGLVAYLINGLLGVEKEDLFRDYLFSNFGAIGSARNLGMIEDLYVNKLDAYEGNNLSEKIYTYLNEKVGVPKEQIDSVIAILKEFAPSRGDADLNGRVEEQDAVLMAKYLTGWNVDLPVESGDIDGDGMISDWDYILTARFLAGWDIVYFAKK